MNGNGKIGMALVGGYLLGRTRKARMAIGMGMFLAGKKLDLKPGQLVKLVADSPVIGGLGEQVRKEVVDGTKSALTSAVTRRADTLADSLHRRTSEINDPEGHEDSEGADAEDRTAGDEQADEDSADGGRSGDGRADEGAAEDEQPRPRRKAASAGGARKSAGSAKSAASARTSGGSTARKTAGGTAGRSSGKRAESATRKSGTAASSGARGGTRGTGGTGRAAAKSASSRARKTAARGGSDG